MKKKIVALIICSIFGITSLAGCGNSANNSIEATTNSVTETSGIEETEMSSYDAESILIDYIENNQSTFEMKVLGINSFNIEHIEHLEVSTIECTNSPGSGPPYGFSIKGNFYGMDDYGRVKGHYNYSMSATVDSEGKVKLKYADVSE